MGEHVSKMADAGFRQFYFVDNTFNLPSAYAIALCRAIADRRLNIAWRCILYPQQVPEDLVEAMAKPVALTSASASRAAARASCG